LGIDEVNTDIQKLCLMELFGFNTLC